MVDEQDRIQELLADLEDYLDGLREKQGVSKERFERDDDLQDIVERRLEKATQTCIDIGRLIGRLEGRNFTDETNAAVFIALVELDVLPPSNRQALPVGKARYHHWNTVTEPLSEANRYMPRPNLSFPRNRSGQPRRSRG